MFAVDDRELAGGKPAEDEHLTGDAGPGLRNGGPWAGYASEGDHPLGVYGMLAGIFLGLFAVFLGVRHRARRDLPARVAASDITLLGVATFRLSRLLAKDSVSSFLRAPFTSFDSPTGDGEVKERPRGTGVRHAVGELLVCPFCIGQWVAAAFTYGLVLAPRITRLVAAMLAVHGLSDVLQLGYEAAKKRVLQMPGG